MSSSSLYANTGNVTVSSKNLTTLYNATTGNTVVANVPDRNFTTLYSSASQTQITPTKPYGNSNVEAFLNSGSDGANSVQNIVMSGNITVGQQSFLGNVGNVHITGGTSGYILATDGLGHLDWIEGFGDSSTIPYVHFDVSSTGINQVFSNTNIGLYSSDIYMSVFKNGVNIEPSQYSISGNDLTISILLNAGDTIDVLPQGGRAANAEPAGTFSEVQFNNGLSFGSSANFTFDTTGNVLTVTNLEVPGETTLGAVANVHISGGSNSQVLTTDGAGNLTWTSVSSNAANANYANFAGTAYNVSVGNVSGIGNIATINLTGSTSNVLYGNGAFGPAGGSPGGSNTYIQYNNNGVFGGFSGLTIDTVTNTLNIGNLNATGANVSLGSNTALRITGGVAGQGLITDGLGNLSWGNQTYSNSSNVTLSGTTTVQQIKEKVTTSGTGATGNINFDVLTSAISFYNANATGNVSLNFRANSTTTLNTLMANNESMTVSFLNKNGATAYIVSNVKIDGTAANIVYQNGLPPSVGTVNGIDVYNYNIIKTGTNTFTVFSTYGTFS